MNKKWSAIALLCLISLYVPRLEAQFDGASEGGGEDEVEALYDKLDDGEVRKARKPTPQRTKEDEKKITTLTDLADLSPFTDVAVISRKFLPKTGRFEISGAGMLGINNEFFNNIGAGIRAAYYFTEKYGIEAMYFFLSDSERDVTKNLKEKVDIETESLVRPKSFLGATFKWMPIYGKLAFAERKIVSYDMYFQAGAGMTETELKSETAFTLGAGQIFAMSKSMAVRWDFTWNLYQATVEIDDKEKKSNHNDLYLSVGLSFFFPEASYR